MTYFNNKQKRAVYNMTYKEYCMQIVETIAIDTSSTNDWGWFVDIELNPEPIKNTQNNSIYKPYQNVSNIYSTFRSIKKLQDKYFINDRSNNVCFTIISNSIGVIVLFIGYFIIKQ